MKNDDIADILERYADLCVLFDENPIRVKSYQAAAFRISKMNDPIHGKSINELELLEGVGKRMAKVVYSIDTSGSFDDLNALLEKTPHGLLDLLKISGLGPAKVKVLWHEADIIDLDCLKEACLDNRLASIKGFGAKTQEKILKQVLFQESIKPYYRWESLEIIADNLLEKIKSLGFEWVEFSGEYFRACEVLKQIDFIIICNDPIDFNKKISSIEDLSSIDVLSDEIKAIFEQVPVRFIRTTLENKYYDSVKFSSNDIHLEQLGFSNLEQRNFASEIEIYQTLQKPFCIPELREGLNEWKSTRRHPSLRWLEQNDLQGIFHNHSTWSDGKNTIIEMANACRALGLQYLGMADHSQTAAYANGLSIERVIKQWEEIDELNRQSKDGFFIFKGIESDILGNGSLDYPDDILNQFDYVVASIHSQLDMDEEKAMSRLIKAIENPHTTMLGHPSGRLLLWRQGYPLNHIKLIDACAANEVIIEINANPYRLDIDWRYLDYMMEKGVMTSINPDAHNLEGIKDIRYGVHTARKGGVIPEMCFNTWTLEKIKSYLLK